MLLIIPNRLNLSRLRLLSHFAAMRIMECLYIFYVFSVRSAMN
jgi:hypothetical protein